MTAQHCVINIVWIAAGWGERSFCSDFASIPSCAAARGTALVCVSAMLSAAAGDTQEAEVVSRQVSAMQLPFKKGWETLSLKLRNICANWHVKTAVVTPPHISVRTLRQKMKTWDHRYPGLHLPVCDSQQIRWELGLIWQKHCLPVPWEKAEGF